MKGLSLTAAKELAQKVARKEEQEKRARLLGRVASENAVGAVAGLLAAPLAGFVSAKLDTRFDDVSGDGITVLGVPALPLAGAVAAGLGYYMGGASGAAVREAGLATLHGSLFQYAFNKAQRG